MIKQYKSNFTNSHRNGFSLLEILLTTGLLSVLLIVIFNILQNYAEDVLARSTAEYYGTINTALEQTLENPDYFNRIYNLASAEPNNILELTLNDLVNGFGSAPDNLIPALSMINSSFQNRNPYGAQSNIFIRVASNTGNPDAARALEIIIASTQRLDQRRLRNTASKMKSYGGYYSGSNVSALTPDITASYGSWGFSQNNLSGTDWFATVNSNPPSADEGGYLVHYKHINYDDVAGDYLYRNRVDGDADLNTMYTDLDLGNNNILGVDNMNVDDELNLSAKAIVNGSMTVGGSATFNQADFTANNALNITNNATINGNGSGVTGNMTVQGNVLVDGDASFSDRLSARSALFSGGLGTAGTISSQTIEAGSVQSSTLNVTEVIGNNTTIAVTGNLNAGNVSTSNLTITNGELITDDISLRGNTTIEGNLTGYDMDINSLSVEAFGQCEKGC